MTNPPPLHLRAETIPTREFTLTRQNNRYRNAHESLVISRAAQILSSLRTLGKSRTNFRQPPCETEYGCEIRRKTNNQEEAEFTLASAVYVDVGRRSTVRSVL